MDLPALQTIPFLHEWICLLVDESVLQKNQLVCMDSVLAYGHHG